VLPALIVHPDAVQRPAAIGTLARCQRDAEEAADSVCHHMARLAFRTWEVWFCEGGKQSEAAATMQRIPGQNVREIHGL
jgi:hypothetical protein